MFMLTVVGNISIDIYVRGVARLPEVGGEEMSAASIVKTDEPVITTMGGGGGTTAFASAALGEAVRLWSAVGSDPVGALALDWLEGRHIDTTSVRIMAEEGTSTNVFISGDGRAHGILHYPGAAGAFAPRVKSIGGGGTDWLFVTDYANLPNWRGANMVELLRNARRAGLNTALDTGAGPEEHATPEELNDLLPYTGLLFIERSELDLVSGTDMVTAARQALGAGVGAVVVRRGREGVTLFGKDVSEKGTDVDATSAAEEGPSSWSDCFNAGLLYARARGKTLE